MPLLPPSQEAMQTPGSDNPLLNLVLKLFGGGPESVPGMVGPMALMGTGRAAQQFGPDIVESLRNLAKTGAGKHSQASLNPRVLEHIKDQLGMSDAWGGVLSHERDITMEGVTSLFSKLSPEAQKRVAKQAFREGRQGGPWALPDAIENLLEWRKQRSYPQLFKDLLRDLFPAGQ